MEVIKMKKILAVFIACLVAFCMFVSAAGTMKIFVDLQEVPTDTPPQIINGRTMVPVRAITEMIGYEVKWINETKQVEIYKPGDEFPTIIMNIGKPVAAVSKYVEELGENVIAEEPLDSPPVIVNGRTLVPLSFISVQVGYTVDYNVDSRDVYIFSPEYMQNQIGEGKGEDIDGEGIGVTQPVTQDEINYVISFRTKSWLELRTEQKEIVVSIIARWWDEVDGYVVEDFDEMLAALDHQMETYSRNNVDEGVFQTACDIYEIDVSKYIMG